jgi:predicted Zn-ribbon and HTH transcriptional regulator
VTDPIEQRRYCNCGIILYGAHCLKCGPEMTRTFRFARCGRCGGQFDEAEWDASSACPECETPKATGAAS